MFISLAQNKTIISELQSTATIATTFGGGYLHNQVEGLLKNISIEYC